MWIINISDIFFTQQISLPQKAPKLCCGEEEKQHLQVGLGLLREEHPLLEALSAGLAKGPFLCKDGGVHLKDTFLLFCGFLLIRIMML